MIAAEHLYVVLLASMAGAAMPVGALLARFDLMHPALLGPNSRHFIVAFGGGALLSAVALVLVPEGSSKLSLLSASACFAAGGAFFYCLGTFLEKSRSSAGQLVAMLADFLPEAIALGTAVATGEETVLLLAMLMVLQNIPEGFSAYEELVDEPEVASRKILIAFSALALTGPLCALAGYLLLAHAHQFVGGLMLFASAGILYLVFQDIAPESRVSNSGIPAIGAVAGFSVGLIGNMLITTA
ncbi:MAG: divalent cation transporter [Halioglobus sp.]